MPKDELPGISDETAEMLDAHVKKGKTRKFFLIYKGASIKTLVVFKKGPYGPKIMKAKKDGFKGEVVTGIITGKGKNLLLQLPGNANVADAMKAEGFVDSPPLKKTKLKEFLGDNGLRVKPDFEIVTAVNAVLNGESDDEINSAQLDAMAAEDGADSDESGPTDEQGKKLGATLKAMKPLIVAGIQADPSRKDEIQETVQVLSDQIKASDYDQATEGIKSFAEMLKGLTSPSAPPPPPPPPGETDPERSEWDWREKELNPKLRQVLEGKLGDFQAVGALFKEAKQKLSEDAGAAVDLLRQCAEKVDSILKADSQPSVPEATADDYRNSWLQAATQFSAQRKDLESSAEDKLAEFDRLATEANAMASQGDYQGALRLALEMADIHASAQKVDVSSEIAADLVPFVKARLGWVDARTKLRSELGKLKTSILAAAKDDDELEEIEDNVDDIFLPLVSFDSQLEETLEALVETPDGAKRENLKSQVADLVKSYSTVLSEPFFQQIDNNPFTQVAVLSTAKSSLVSVAKALRG